MQKLLEWERSGNSLARRIDLAWSPRCTVKCQTILDHLGQKAEHSTMKLLQMTLRDLDVRMTKLSNDRGLGAREFGLPIPSGLREMISTDGPMTGPMGRSPTEIAQILDRRALGGPSETLGGCGTALPWSPEAETSTGSEWSPDASALTSPTVHFYRGFTPDGRASAEPAVVPRPPRRAAAPQRPQTCDPIVEAPNGRTRAEGVRQSLEAAILSGEPSTAGRGKPKGGSQPSPLYRRLGPGGASSS